MDDEPKSREFKPKETPPVVTIFSDFFVLMPLMAYCGATGWIVWQLLCGSFVLGFAAAIFWIPLAGMLVISLHQQGSIRLSVSLGVSVVLALVVALHCFATNR